MPANSPPKPPTATTLPMDAGGYPIAPALIPWAGAAPDPGQGQGGERGEDVRTGVGIRTLGVERIGLVGGRHRDRELVGWQVPDVARSHQVHRLGDPWPEQNHAQAVRTGFGVSRHTSPLPVGSALPKPTRFWPTCCWYISGDTCSPEPTIVIDLVRSEMVEVSTAPGSGPGRVPERRLVETDRCRDLQELAALR